MHAFTGLAKRGAAGPGCGLVIFALVIFMSLGVMTEGLVFATGGERMVPVRPNLGVFPEGEITGVGTAALEIDGRTYGLHPKMMIVADEGHQLELKQLRVGLIVQYHLKEGALDHIIVIIPR